VLDQLLQRTAIAEFARQHGMRAGKRLVDSELRQMPRSAAPTAASTRTRFAPRWPARLTEALVRDGSRVRPAGAPAAHADRFSPVMPASFGQRYARCCASGARARWRCCRARRSRRPARRSDAQLQTFYRPGKAAGSSAPAPGVRIASFGDEALGDHGPLRRAEADPATLPSAIVPTMRR
jgi:peptidyl-prolyl cis-trans isomerase D